MLRTFDGPLDCTIGNLCYGVVLARDCNIVFDFIPNCAVTQWPVR